jgi:hypothetical protein
MTYGLPLSRLASSLTNNRHDKYEDRAYAGSLKLLARRLSA